MFFPFETRSYSVAQDGLKLPSAGIRDLATTSQTDTFFDDKSCFLCMMYMCCIVCVHVCVMCCLCVSVCGMMYICVFCKYVWCVYVVCAIC